MFISVLDLFKVGIGPSSSHTMGPMVAAADFSARVGAYLDGLTDGSVAQGARLRCTLRGSLAHTGHGHATDRAVALGLSGYTPIAVAGEDVDALVARIGKAPALLLGAQKHPLAFSAASDIVFDLGEPLPEHPNGMIFESSPMEITCNTSSTTR